MLKKYKADMHIHTCLSPCSDWDMSPRKIVRQSLNIGLDIIAICDHNTAENCGAGMREGESRGLPVLPGIEICSKEEVHILALFDKLEQVLAMQDYVYANLSGENQPEVFGYQVVANELLIFPYLIAVSVPFLASSRRSLVLFGLGIAASCAAAWYLSSATALPSVWCFFAAILSGGLYLNFRAETRVTAHQPKASEKMGVVPN